MRINLVPVILFILIGYFISIIFGTAVTTHNSLLLIISMLLTGALIYIFPPFKKINKERDNENKEE